MKLTLGQVAPEFSLADQHNQIHHLADYHGQWVVLYFYPKDHTPICTAEACYFRDHSQAITAKQAVILGVSVDSVAKHQDFAQQFQLPFSLLSDSKGQVAKQYGALLDLIMVRAAKRHSFIIDPTGHIVKIYQKVTPETHVADILQDLTELQNTIKPSNN